MQADLKLSDKQKAEAADINNSLTEERHKLFAEVSKESKERGKKVAELEEKTSAKVNKLLDDAQQKRLREILVQVNGASELLKKDVQKELGITEEQAQRNSPRLTARMPRLAAKHSRTTMETRRPRLSTPTRRRQEASCRVNGQATRGIRKTQGQEDRARYIQSVSTIYLRRQQAATSVAAAKMSSPPAGSGTLVMRILSTRDWPPVFCGD